MDAVTVARSMRGSIGMLAMAWLMAGVLPVSFSQVMIRVGRVRGGFGRIISITPFASTQRHCAYTSGSFAITHERIMAIFSGSLARK